ncbi:hypothetical protein HK100_003072 [Physocladia obscura]|uniref:Uncharacterized protein n=1 Tax=Physocladia obscura TaxID=109957 RepID=A0AAD5SUX1_9FUNG|nr:hypothetical protein HK100_003072 [Physocladia obscura]
MRVLRKRVESDSSSHSATSDSDDEVDGRQEQNEAKQRMGNTSIASSSSASVSHDSSATTVVPDVVPGAGAGVVNTTRHHPNTALNNNGNGNGNSTSGLGGRSFARVGAAKRTPPSPSPSSSSSFPFVGLALGRPEPIKTNLRSMLVAASSSSSDCGSEVMMDCETEPESEPTNDRAPAAALSSPMIVATPLQLPTAKRSISRVATLIKREARPFDEELAHENATMSFLNRIHPLFLDANSAAAAASSATSASPMVSASSSNSSAHIGLALAQLDEVLIMDEIPSLPRTIPIPNRDVRDPASYASHTSKLNPENLMYRTNYETASPILSPSHMQITTGLFPTHISPILTQKTKRKMSGGSESDRYEPYKRRNTTSVSVTPRTYSATMTNAPSSINAQPSSSSSQPHQQQQQQQQSLLSSLPSNISDTTVNVLGASSASAPLPASPSASSASMFMSPRGIPMSMPSSPNVNWNVGLPASNARVRAAIATGNNGCGGSAENPFLSGNSNGSGSGGSAMQGFMLQQPLLPGPLMGLMMSGHMGSPYMRRSTSASSAGSNYERGGNSMFGTSGANGFIGNANIVPGSPRVGVVFGGGANLVVASPRAAKEAGGSSSPAIASAPGTAYGQLLNLGGFVSDMNQLKFS